MSVNHKALRPRLHYANSSLGELQEILKASQDEVSCRVFPPLVLRPHLSQQAGACDWVRGGYFIWILYLKGKESEKNCLNIKQIFFSGGML